MIKFLLAISLFCFNNSYGMSPDAIAEQFKDKDFVKAKLRQMVKADQGIRTKMNPAKMDEKSWAKVIEVDKENTKILKAILNIYSWITISEFGAEHDNNTWLLVQHADQDIEFQKEILGKLEKLYLTKKTDPRNYAYLYDRVAVNQNKPQKFGTQAKIIDGKLILYDVEDMQNLGVYRKQFNLEPIDDYIKSIENMFLPKK